jgi:hypothetical protein
VPRTRRGCCAACRCLCPAGNSFSIRPAFGGITRNSHRGRTVENAVLYADRQKARERRPRALDTRPFRRTDCSAIADHDDRLAPGIASLVLLGRQGNRLNRGAEAFKQRYTIDHLQRVALRGNHRQSLVDIKKAGLPLAPTSAILLSQVKPAQISGGELFFGCFRAIAHFISGSRLFSLEPETTLKYSDLSKAGA